MHVLYSHTKTPISLLVVILLVAISTTSCRSSETPAPTTVTSTSTTVMPTTVISTEGLKDINGTQLYYQSIGKGAPLFFVHGRSGSHRYFLPQVEPLSNDYQLLLYDQRGTGASNGKIDIKAITIDQFVEDLESLRVSFGFEKISLMGHSWGAIIALFYAIKHQDHLDKLILVDPIPLATAFLVAQNQTLQERFRHLNPRDQQTLNSVCGRSQQSPEERTDCLKRDATLRFFDPAKVLTMDNTVEKIP